MGWIAKNYRPQNILEYIALWQIRSDLFSNLNGNRLIKMLIAQCSNYYQRRMQHVRLLFDLDYKDIILAKELT